MFAASLLTPNDASHYLMYILTDPNLLKSPESINNSAEECSGS